MENRMMKSQYTPFGPGCTKALEAGSGRRAEHDPPSAQRAEVAAVSLSPNGDPDLAPALAIFGKLGGGLRGDRCRFLKLTISQTVALVGL